jgi:hypothetical protein
MSGLIHIVFIAVAAWCVASGLLPDSLTAEQPGSTQMEVFRDPVTLSYGDRDIVAPLKGGLLLTDWDRDGKPDLVVKGYSCRDTGKRRDGAPVYRRLARVDLGGGGQIVGLNANGRDDLVRLTKDGYLWAEDANEKGARNFVDQGKLAFAGGGDLPLMDSFGSVEHFKTWQLKDVGDLDGDGLPDLLLTKFTCESLNGDQAYCPWEFAGFETGWIDGQWIFHDFAQTFWWQRNVGTKKKPRFTLARLLTVGPLQHGLTFPCRAVSGSLIDFNADGATDLFVHAFDASIVYLRCGQSPNHAPRFDDGHRITFAGEDSMDYRRAAIPALMEDGLIHLFFHGGTVCGEAVQQDPDDPFAFGPMRWLLFENPALHLDTFTVPDAADWDGDGKLDLIVGSEAGNVWFLKNLDPEGLPRKWAAPKLLTADGKDLRQFLYRHENLQGPEELLIGYSNPTVEDWDLDGDLDIVAGCHGETYYLFENTGTATEPSLAFRGPLRHGTGHNAAPVRCAWRTRPGVGDVTGDGLPDLIGVDGKQMLTLWRRYRGEDGKLRLSPPQYPVDAAGDPFVNCRDSRGLGRSKLCVVDWDRDGRLDILSSPNLGTGRDCQFFYRNLEMREGKLEMEFQPERIRVTGMVPKGTHTHFRMLEPVDFDGNGRWEGITGMDRGYLYYWPETERQSKTSTH